MNVFEIQHPRPCEFRAAHGLSACVDPPGYVGCGCTPPPSDLTTEQIREQYLLERLAIGEVRIATLESALRNIASAQPGYAPEDAVAIRRIARRALGTVYRPSCAWWAE
jgi:hypothetical protein